jgi:hypothetical protein
METTDIKLITLSEQGMKIVCKFQLFNVCFVDILLSPFCRQMHPYEKHQSLLDIGTPQIGDPHPL